MSTRPPVHSRSSNGTPLYERRCRECGNVAVVDSRKLELLCAQCAAKARRTHGLSAGGKIHPLYRLLLCIKARCTQPSATNFKYYGGRGIKVCDEWLDNPPQFVEWATANGWQRGMELDRIDVDGPYSPDNCRFVTHRQNSQTTRRIKTTEGQAAHVRRLLADGSNIKDAARLAGVTYMVAWHIKNSPDVWSNA
jgi:hypothetical protein